jgi:hypothetical protein
LKAGSPSVQFQSSTPIRARKHFDMSGMEPLLIASVVAGSATAAYGHAMAGQEASHAAEFEQQQLQIQSQTQHIAADQEEARRRDELTANIETIQALRAGRGVGAGAPGETALLTSVIDTQERDIGTSRFNYLQRADLSSRAALLAGRKAQTSLLAGDLSAAGDVFGAGSRIAGIYGKPGTGAALPYTS